MIKLSVFLFILFLLSCNSKKNQSEENQKVSFKNSYNKETQKSGKEFYSLKKPCETIGKQICEQVTFTLSNFYDQNLWVYSKYSKIEILKDEPDFLSNEVDPYSQELESHDDILILDANLNIKKKILTKEKWTFLKIFVHNQLIYGITNEPGNYKIVQLDQEGNTVNTQNLNSGYIKDAWMLKNGTLILESNPEPSKKILTVYDSNLKVKKSYEFKNVLLTYGGYSFENDFYFAYDQSISKFNDNLEVLWTYNLEKSQRLDKGCLTVYDQKIIVLAQTQNNGEKTKGYFIQLNENGHKIQEKFHDFTFSSEVNMVPQEIFRTPDNGFIVFGFQTPEGKSVLENHIAYIKFDTNFEAKGGKLTHYNHNGGESKFILPDNKFIIQNSENIILFE